MQPKRLLQATSLLLLSAAVFAQVESSAAIPSMAALPAEVRTAATNCRKDFGDLCSWGDSCARIVPHCQLCENQVCAYCKVGFFLDTEDNTCTECPQGGFCGGKSTDPTEPGSKWACPFPTFTDGPGKWSPTQCSTCFIGYSHAHEGRRRLMHGGMPSCAACEAGTAKNLVGEKECDYCLDGFIANANKGATDCIYVGSGGRRLMQPSANEDAAAEACAEVLETDTDDEAIYIVDENSCGCPPFTVLKTAQVEYDEEGDWSVVPPRCVATCMDHHDVDHHDVDHHNVDHHENLVFSITGEPEAGLTECKKCPSNSKAADDARSCKCLDGFEPRPDFENDGCMRIPAMTGTGSGSGGDDNKDEWGHWSHKKGNKHSKKHHDKYEKEKEYSDRK